MRSRAGYSGGVEISSDLPGALTAAMHSDWRGASAVAVGIVLLFAAGEVLRRVCSIETEYTRKLSHLGAGFIVAAFPWLLDHTLTVAVLAAAFFVLLLVGKLTGMLESVHGVERQTSGAYYYPLAVLGIFWLSRGDPLLYCPPVMVLAISDTGAALVGKRMGRRRYRVMDGARSVEGSLTFFGLTFTIVLAALALAGRPGWPEMLLVTLVVAIMATTTEAVSVRGTDNLFIPYACFLILERALRMGLAELSGWFEGMIVSLALMVLTWGRSGLTEAGGLTVFIVGTLAWALGGWSWALPLAALYGIFIAAVPAEDVRQTDMTEIFPATMGSMIVVLAFGHFQDDTLFVPYLATLATGGAIAMQNMAQSRDWPQLPLAFSGALAPTLPVLLIDPTIPLKSIGAAAAGGVLAFALLSRTPLVGRRLLASLLAGALAWAAS